MANTHVKRENALRYAFVKILLKAPVRQLKFFDGTISLTFFGQRLSDKIVLKKEDHVAEWSRRRKEIFIDKKFKPSDMERSFKALCIHEVIEKFLVEKFGLRLDEEAHVVATRKEKEYLESKGGSWKSHELMVYWDWHKQGER
ncbi:MAG: hypothetical protein HYW24_03505 [Candidatus Aenigmarchaeota archaeon]|nr:hypothetical protein [Candidatus Aenigmarchaeota archaeon]